jgi:UDP-N-acetylmuramoyl-tripeptide--D-alanyl-D-alanine ligase
MITMSLPELARIIDAAPKSISDSSFSGFSIDSRTIKPGNVYVAIRGTQFDGHSFIAQAFESGAVAAIVDELNACPIPQLCVPDTVKALGLAAANWRDRFDLPLIAVTGSNGKTTLKNMIASILKAKTGNADHVFATLGNFNNEIGLPLTLARLNKSHQFGVVEMGMNHSGEIAYLTRLTKPHVAVINNAAASHLEGVGGNLYGVAKAKGEIFLGLQLHGMAIINRDDVHYDYWCSLIPNHKRMSFSLLQSADVTATLLQQSGSYQTIALNTPVGETTIKLPLLGTHNAMNALAATAAALAINIDLDAIAQGLETIEAAPGRLNQYVLTNGARIIDDTYNANPFSLDAALDCLAIFPGKKILVLGDMKELGQTEHALHATAGVKARAAHIDYVFTLGKLSQATTNSFGENAQHFTDMSDLIKAITPFADHETVILVKGSRSMHMEKIVAALVPKHQLLSTH